MRNITDTLLFIFAFAVLASGQTPTIDQSLNMKTAGGPRISPDGRYVAIRSRKPTGKTMHSKPRYGSRSLRPANDINSPTPRSRVRIRNGRRIQNESRLSRTAMESGSST